MDPNNQNLKILFFGLICSDIISAFSIVLVVVAVVVPVVLIILLTAAALLCYKYREKTNLRGGGQENVSCITK